VEHATVIKAFLSSPGDVKDEREIVHQIVLKINSNEGRFHQPRFFIDLYRWEKDLISGWGTPQENINKQLKPDESDIFIGILWSRFGTPTGDFQSGTEEEFNSALSKWRQTGSAPRLLFYHCTNLDSHVSFLS